MKRKQLLAYVKDRRGMERIELGVSVGVRDARRAKIEAASFFLSLLLNTC
jgi:hypothetical protein